MKKNIEVKTNNQTRTPQVVDPFSQMNRTMERFFSDPFGSFWNDFQLAPQRRSALSDIQETDKAYFLSVDVPGIPKDQIDVQVHGNILTIKAEQKEEQEDKEQGYSRHYRSFNQSFSLPSTVDAEKVEAKCEDGMLEIVLPKVAQAQPRRIQIHGRNEEKTQSEKKH